MRDTRKTREMIVTMAAAAIGAVLGDYYLKPVLNQALGVKKK